jgi:hypothetical protein
MISSASLESYKMFKRLYGNRKLSKLAKGMLLGFSPLRVVIIVII